jgi:hypothetical protein
MILDNSYFFSTQAGRNLQKYESDTTQRILIFLEHFLVGNSRSGIYSRMMEYRRKYVDIVTVLLQAEAGKL